MKLIPLVALLTTVGICSSGIAYASQPENTIRKNVAEVVGAPIEKITKTEFAELYELVTPNGIAYTDKNGSFVLFNGVVIEAKTKSNLSEKRMGEISKFKFADLPLKDAIKIVNGNGKRVLATLEDPNCGYCKKLAPELAKLENTTIYTFIVPILGEDSVVKARSTWCAADKSATWLTWMRDNKAPEIKANCETPNERNVMLSQKLRAMGTPAILFQSGERIPGFTTADKIEEKLSAK